MQGALDDAARQITVILRDIDRVAEVDDKEVSAAVRAAVNNLGNSALVLGSVAGVIAERRACGHPITDPPFVRPRLTRTQQEARHASHAASHTAKEPHSDA